MVPLPEEVAQVRQPSLNWVGIMNSIALWVSALSLCIAVHCAACVPN
jgi:hypothetical protein